MRASILAISALAIGLAAGCGAGSTPVAAVTAAAGAPAAPDPAPSGRLGDSVVPRRARLEVALDPDREDFRGQVEFELDLARPVAAIWLHQRDLEILGATLSVAGQEIGLAVLESPEAQPDLLGLAIGRRVGPGPARLRVAYRGRFGDRVGLFRQRLAGQWYAYTDFEPADARSAFPCFDDPRFKIPWQVTLVVPRRFEPFGNSAPRREQRKGGNRRVEFAETRPLPSYLVGFAAGPFEVVTAPGPSSVPIRLVVPRGQATLTADALAAASRLLGLAEEYMGQRSPFGKLDFIAVPELPGAMENPGLITVARAILLLDPTEPDSESRRDRLLLLHSVLAHEIAHLWFGDLVTMEYWTELWLNEGLATWMSDRLLAGLEPDLAGEILPLADKVKASREDRRLGARVVRHPVRTEADAGHQFDSMNYRKGGAIAAMIEALIGRGAMRAGLRSYVRARADRVARTRDLAAALSAVVRRDLEPVLHSFLDQPGIPVVEAALECGAARPRVALRQSGYAALGAPAGEANRRRAQRWHIPVCIRFEGGARPVCSVLGEERGAVELPASRCPGWIHPNPDEHGYYFYALPAAQLGALASSQLTAREQAGLAENIDALLRSGHLPLGAGLDALLALGRRGDPEAVLRSVDSWRLVARSVVEPARRRALASRLTTFAPLARRLGVELARGDGAVTRGLRSALVPLVGRDAGDPVLQRAAHARLDAWLRDDRGPAPSREELDLLYQLAPLAGGVALFNRLHAAGQSRASPALTGYRTPALIRRALGDITAGQLGPSAALSVMGGYLADHAAHGVALPVALGVFEDLAGRLADTDRLRAARIFEPVCRPAARDQVAAVLERTLSRDGHLPPEAARVLEKIDECLAFRRHHLPAAVTYF